MSEFALADQVRVIRTDAAHYGEVGVVDEIWPEAPGMLGLRFPTKAGYVVLAYHASELQLVRADVPPGRTVTVTL